MNARKFRWSQVYESSEEELVEFLQSRGITANRVHATSQTELVVPHTESVRIWCAEGSMTIASGATKFSLQPGDAVGLTSGQSYNIFPGLADCTYYRSS